MRAVFFCASWYFGTASRYPNLALWRYRLAEACGHEGQLERARRLLADSPAKAWGGVIRADRARRLGLAPDPDFASIIDQHLAETR